MQMPGGWFNNPMQQQQQFDMMRKRMSAGAPAPGPSGDFTGGYAGGNMSPDVLRMGGAMGGPAPAGADAMGENPIALGMGGMGPGMAPPRQFPGNTGFDPNGGPMPLGMGNATRDPYQEMIARGGGFAGPGGGGAGMSDPPMAPPKPGGMVSTGIPPINRGPLQPPAAKPPMKPPVARPTGPGGMVSPGGPTNLPPRGGGMVGGVSPGGPKLMPPKPVPGGGMKTTGIPPIKPQPKMLTPPGGGMRVPPGGGMASSSGGGVRGNLPMPPKKKPLPGGAGMGRMVSM